MKSKIGSTGFTDAQQAAMYYGRKRRRALSVEDEYYANVVLLTSLDEGDGATATTDKSQYAHDMTSFFSFCALDADRKRFGNSSLFLESAGARGISIPDSDVFNMGTDDFSIELWWAPPTAEPGGAMTLFSHWDANGDQRGWTIEYDVTNNRIVFFASTDGTFAGIWSAYFDLDDDGPGGGADALFDGLFHFINVDRRGGVVTVWVDGNPGVAGQNDGGSTIHASTANPVIGAQQFGAATLYEASGHIDEVRWTIGQSRYDPGEKFDPPETPFPFVGGSGDFGSIAEEEGSSGDPYIGNVVALLKFNGADDSEDFTGVDVVGGLTLLERHSTIKATQSADFTLHGAASLHYVNGCRPQLGGSGAGLNAGLIMGTDDFTIDLWLYVPVADASERVIFALGESLGSPMPNAFMAWVAAPATGVNSRIKWQVQTDPQVSDSTGAYPGGEGGFFNLISEGNLTDASDLYGNWRHMHFSRNGADLIVGCNGANKTFAGVMGSLPVYHATWDLGLMLGCTEFLSGTNNSLSAANMYFDSFRVTKGICRFTGATYTVPGEFPETA